MMGRGIFKKLNNQGSAVVEATLALPIFLFMVISLYEMCCSKMAELEVYEAGAETAAYMAEYAYISDLGAFVPPIVFKGYINNKSMVDKAVIGGVDNIVFPLCEGKNSEGITTLRAFYKVGITVPLIPRLTKEKSFTIRQFAYVGAGCHWDENDEEYVFMTENGGVYHRRRSCQYLVRDTRIVDIVTAKGEGYTVCELCGKYGGDKAYVTEDGQRYHFSKICSSLKRTVHRVKKSEVEGKTECSMCRREIGGIYE